jgi:hypothetical protein
MSLPRRSDGLPFGRLRLLPAADGLADHGCSVYRVGQFNTIRFNSMSLIEPIQISTSAAADVGVAPGTSSPRVAVRMPIGADPTSLDVALAVIRRRGLD